MPRRPGRRDARCRRATRQGPSPRVVRLLAIFSKNVHPNAGQPACICVPEGRQPYRSKGSHTIYVLRRGERQAGRPTDLHQYRRGFADQGTD